MIGIVGFNDLHLLQFLYKYTNILDKHGITDYEVIFWNRSAINWRKNFDGEALAYSVPLNTYLPFHRKICAFWGYTKFLNRIIKSKKYDRLIILTTQSAIPLYNRLIKKYRNRFIYDYRDITKETVSKVYLSMVKKLIKASNCTMMSSLGFLEELNLFQDENIILAHNTQEMCSHSEYVPSINEKDPIRISFWGMIRQPELNCTICDIFGNDPRFILTYHGEGMYKEIQDHCEKMGYTNIYFTGRYTMDQIPLFAENTDIIHCLYEYRNDVRMKSALQVKLYDAIKYRKPLLLYKNSYVSNYVNDDTLALSLDVEGQKTMADEVYNWYRSLQMDIMEKKFSFLEQKVYQDDLIFENRLLKFVKD